VLTCLWSFKARGRSGAASTMISRRGLGCTFVVVSALGKASRFDKPAIGIIDNKVLAHPAAAWM
jgi:hypothetical protein